MKRKGQDMKSIAAILGLAVATLFVAPVAHAQPGWCHRASLPAEKAICANSQLWNLDGAINTAYHRALSDSPGQQYYIRQSQRSWLKDRNRCGYNVTCIHNRYVEQIGYLEGFFYN